MRHFGALGRQGFVMKLLRRLRVQGKVKLILPAELKPCPGESIVTSLGTRVGKPRN